MFLFENFTYDNRWASLYYLDFYDASDYLTKWLNDGFDIDKAGGKFWVKRCYDQNHAFTRYEVGYDDFRHIHCDDRYGCFPRDAHDYAFHKLENADNGVYVDAASKAKDHLGDNLRKIIISYNKEDDERRWNLEHKEIDNLIKNDKILVDSLHPSLEQWITMLDNYHMHKNPKMLFNKEKDIKLLISKYVIAVKLGWVDAINALELKISEMIVKLEKNDGIVLSPRIKKAIKCYAYEMYQIDYDIENIINAFKDSAKNKSDRLLPTTMNDICKVLDDNSLVDEYTVKDRFGQTLIEIKTYNGNIGYIIIKEIPAGTYRGMWKVVLSFDNNWETVYQTLPVEHFAHIAKYDIEAVVRAIYKNDPKELNKIVIKI